jgi:Uma2 family endonuclease
VFRSKIRFGTNSEILDQIYTIAFQATRGDRNDRIPRDENGEIANTFNAAPDWTIEILSPDQNQTKVTKNILYYLKHGPRMGRLIDPSEQTVFVYRPRQAVEVLDEPDLILPDSTVFYVEM